MAKAQPIGFWMNAQEAPKETLLDVARRSKARSHTVANGIGTAQEIYNAAAQVIDDEPIIVVREDIHFDQSYRDPKYHPASYADSAKTRLNGRNRLVWQIWNEPVFVNLEEVRWGLRRAVELMYAFADRGVLFSMGGWATASLWQRDILASGVADEYLRTVSELSHAGYGYDNPHEYVFGSPAHSGGKYYGLDMLDPVKLRRENWPTKEEMTRPSQPMFGIAREASEGDVDELIATQAAYALLSPRATEEQIAHFVTVHHQTPAQFLSTRVVEHTPFKATAAGYADSNWLMMRDVWTDLRCEKLGIRPPLRLKGEAMHDDMPNARIEGWAQKLEQRYAGGKKLRGSLDQLELLGNMFGKDPDEAMMDGYEWAVEVKQDHVLAWHLFGLNYNSQWVTFNYLTRQQWWPAYYRLTDRLVARQGGGSDPVTVVPKPANAGVGSSRKLRTDSYIRVRNSFNTSISTNIVASPPGGTALKVFFDTRRKEGAYWWYWVEGDGFAGWQALVYEYPEEQWIMPSVQTIALLNPASYPHVILEGGKFNAPRNYSHNPAAKQLHEGLDFSSLHIAPEPRLVVAAASGVVQRVVLNDPYYGQYVRISHGNGFRTYYAHMKKVLVSVGDVVAKGQPIGHEGSTGYSSGPHLHLTLVQIGYGLKGYVVADVMDPEPLIDTAVEPPEELPDRTRTLILSEIQALLDELKAMEA